MSEAETVDANTVTSHEQDGRVLSGVGVSADRLAETMERHAPPEPETKPALGTGAAPAPDGQAGVSAPAAEPPPSRGRQRFADLTKERDTAKAEAEALRAEREALARERDELKARVSQPSPAAAEPPKKAEPPPPTRPMPTEDDIAEGKYQSYPEFMRDLIKWELEQERAAAQGTTQAEVREMLALEREAAEFRSAMQSSQDRGRKAYADFDTLLKGPAAKVKMSTDPHEAIERVSYILKHAQSEHIQHAILSDVKLAEQLRDSDQITFGVTIAGLVPAAKPAAPAWTPPPPPYATVGAGSPTTATPSSELPKKGFDFDSSGYREKRAAERGVKTRRW